MRLLSADGPGPHHTRREPGTGFPIWENAPGRWVGVIDDTEVATTFDWPVSLSAGDTLLVKAACDKWHRHVGIEVGVLRRTSTPANIVSPIRPEEEK